MKKIFLALLVLIPALCTYAQESNQQKRSAVNTTFKANRIRDNWFISLHGGVTELMSEETRYLDFGDRIKPAIGLSVGKWMSPVWGIRVNVTAAELQGFATWGSTLGLGDWYVGANHNYPGQGKTNTYVNVYDDPTKAAWVKERFLDKAKNTDDGPGYEYDLKYMGASLDFLLNINNLFRPYYEKRFFEVVAFAGLAYAHTFKESSPVAGYDRTAVNTIGGKGGLQAKFRLSDAFDFHLEGQVYILPEMFDRRVGDGNTMDGVVSYLGGFTYRFKKRGFEEPKVDQSLIDDLNRQINELKARPTTIIKDDDCCDELRARLQRIEDLLNKKEPAQQKEKLNVTVYFTIDKHNVRPSEMYKLDEIASFMNRHPNVKVSVAGYADVKTAYPAYNMKLSERRSNEVVRLLSSKYNIDKSRLSVRSYGDTVQPFSVNEQNRAVIAFDID